MDKLVSYSSSSESDPEPLPKKLKRLPVPFEKEKSTKNEDPAQHDGRKRQIEHVEGNWASHIFIEPGEDFFEKFKEFNGKICERYKDIKTVESPHVSLSKTFILKHHWIDNFYKVLSKNVKFKESSIEFSTELKFLSNEDSSRHFACLLVDHGCQENLQKIVNSIDETLKEFQLPGYYEDSIFHISILWKLTEFTSKEKEAIVSGIKNLMSCDGNFYSLFDKIIFKTGNKVKCLYAH